MSLIWAVLLTPLVVSLGTLLCFWMLKQSRDLGSSIWGTEQVICPILRIIALLLVVSLIYSAASGISIIDFWVTLARSGLVSDLINLLFFGGLVLSFIPLLSHPVVALPAQSLLTVALVFQGQYHESAPLVLWPEPTTALKVLVYMTLAFFVTRRVATRVAQCLDHRFSLSGSILLANDAIYLTLQIPIILVYYQALRLQLP